MWTTILLLLALVLFAPTIALLCRFIDDAPVSPVASNHLKE